MSELYSSGKNKPKTKTGFANKDKVIETLNNIKNKDIIYQKQVVITMYNRAKFHPHRTKEMEKGMKIYESWMNKHKINFS
jgi:hypothetical protein